MPGILASASRPVALCCWSRPVIGTQCSIAAFATAGNLMRTDQPLTGVVVLSIRAC
jgi:hypothetical protein